MLIHFGIIFYLLIPESATLNENGTHNRIYKGVAAKLGQFPYMVYIARGIHHDLIAGCSGSLIKFNTILTAAHCLFDNERPFELKTSDIVVLVGMIDTNNYVEFRSQNPLNVKYVTTPKTYQESIASQLFIHPKYLLDEDYDVGIIKIAKPFVKTAFVDIVPYSTKEYIGPKTCYVIGYGINHFGTNRKLFFFTTKKVKNNLKLCGEPTPDPVYCLRKELESEPSACGGDSGAPLLCDGQIYGVYSSAINYTAIDLSNDCGELVINLFAKLSTSESGQTFVNKHAESLSRKMSKSVQHSSQLYLLLFCFLLFFIKLISYS